MMWRVMGSYSLRQNAFYPLMPVGRIWTVTMVGVIEDCTVGKKSIKFPIDACGLDLERNYVLRGICREDGGDHPPSLNTDLVE